MARDKLSESFLDELDFPPLGQSTGDVIAKWIQNSEAESFFGAKYDMIQERLQRWISDRENDCHRFSDVDLVKLLREDRRTRKALQDELYEWKKSSQQPLSHRARDRTRRPVLKHDFAKSCTRLLAEAERLSVETAPVLGRAILREQALRQVKEKCGL